MAQESQSTEGRALLTDTERAALAGDKSDSYRYKTRSYLKARIEKIERDAEVMAEHAPDLLADLRAAVESDVPRESRDPAQTPVEPERDTHATTDESTTAPSHDAGKNAHTRRGNDATPADDLAGVVDRVADGWDNTDARIDARKEAALAVLEYARENGSVSKTEAKEEVEPAYPVEGQNARTWYRKNIRPVLNEAAEYDQSERGYRLVDTE